jgi:hypothetical protein
MGAYAVELLLERVADPEAPPRHLLLTPPISLRESAGPAPADSRTASSSDVAARASVVPSQESARRAQVNRARRRPASD